MDRTKEVVDRILAGEVLAAARLMRDLDDGVPQAREVLKHLYPHSGRAHIIGITGSPGVGKSTLTDRLIQYLRQQGKTVGVVAVDPTSPFSGGRHPGRPHPHAAPCPGRGRLYPLPGHPGAFRRAHRLGPGGDHGAGRHGQGLHPGGNRGGGPG